MVCACVDVCVCVCEGERRKVKREGRGRKGEERREEETGRTGTKPQPEKERQKVQKESDGDRASAGADGFDDVDRRHVVALHVFPALVCALLHKVPFRPHTSQSNRAPFDANTRTMNELPALKPDEEA
eukprot:968250-Rhodomonas_salina.1